MRIAHVANFYGPRSGGLRTVMHALGAGYRAHGHDVLLVVPGARDGRDDTPWGERVTIASPRIAGTGGYRAITRSGDVRDALDAFAPDIVEVSDRTTLTWVGQWARQRGVPAVFFAHERVDGVLRAHLPGPAASSPWLRRIVEDHHRRTHARFDAVVCTTDFAAGEFRRLGLETTTVPLGVDLARFHPSRADDDLRALVAAPDEKVVVLASRLSPEKRPDLAIGAMRLLAARAAKVCLVCAGAGVLEDRLRREAAGLPVAFLGYVDGRERMAALLATADVVVAPGPIETFGLAALEALASGTPVVAHAESALPEVIGTAGVAARGRPGDFATAIAALLGCERGATRAAARARAESMPWSRTITAMEDLHGRLVDGGIRVAERA